MKRLSSPPRASCKSRPTIRCLASLLPWPWLVAILRLIDSFDCQGLWLFEREILLLCLKRHVPCIAIFVVDCLERSTVQAAGLSKRLGDCRPAQAQLQRYIRRRYRVGSKPYGWLQAGRISLDQQSQTVDKRIHNSDAACRRIDEGEAPCKQAVRRIPALMCPVLLQFGHVF